MCSFKTCLIVLGLIYLQFPEISIGQQTKTTKYFQNKVGIEIKPFSLQATRNDELRVSNLENFRDLFASIKQLLTLQYYANFKKNFKYIQTTGRVQKQISLNQTFPCPLNNTRSAEPPSSVHRLRPGDIDIIGAMGDSLTAGSGMIGKLYLHLLVEFRGQTMLGGGLKNWRTFLTLPNILKEFNPNLYGYAVSNTLAKFHAARFNVAEPIATSRDMPYMAEVLVQRMKSDPKVDMLKHWKMISIFIGANDICNEMCFFDKIQDFLETHRKSLHRTLQILRDNIPRLMVNVFSIPDIDNLIRTGDISDACHAIHKISCSCIIGDTISTKEQQKRHRILRRFQEIDVEVASLTEFQLKEFAAVPRVAVVNKTIRKFKNGLADMGYFAIDCFHLSQYGNAAYTTMLWNEMMQVETKPVTTTLRPFEIFACPSKEKPYLKTLMNDLGNK